MRAGPVQNPRIYFIKPVGMDGPIKIGCSGHVGQRLDSLSVWSPFELEVIISFPGGFKLEKNIHQHFADLHQHHEWFRADQHLLDAIELLKGGMPIEDLFRAVERKAIEAAE